MNYYDIMPLKISQYVYFLTFVCFVQISFGQQPTSENEQRIKAYFQKFPRSDADKDGVLTLQELLTHMRQMRQGNGSSNNDDQFKPEPENTNIRYSDKHERNVLDYYPAKKQDSPAPVYVWFHGGGFSGGDKGSVRKNGGKMIKEYLDQGYAVLSCNYPFINRKSDVLRNGMLDEYVENNFISKETPEQQKSRSEYLKIMAHCGEPFSLFVQNLRSGLLIHKKFVLGVLQPELLSVNGWPIVMTWQRLILMTLLRNLVLKHRSPLDMFNLSGPILLS